MINNSNEQLSNLMDNEQSDNASLDLLIQDKLQQTTFSRYQLIGDVLRNEVALNIDVSESVMSKINEQPILASVTPIQASKPTKVAAQNNVISFVKRFGQYAIAASVAGVVVMTSFITSQPSVENSGIEVLNTVPFGGVSPVSFTSKSSTIETSFARAS